MRKNPVKRNHNPTHGGNRGGGGGNNLQATAPVSKKQKQAATVSAVMANTNSGSANITHRLVAGVSGPTDENVLNNSREEPDATGDKVGDKVQVNIAFMGESKPKTVKELSVTMERLLRQTVDEKIFPYTKFFKQDSELETTGLLYMAFRNVGFIKNNHEDDAKRGKYWKAFMEFIKGRINDRRSAIVAAVKKAAIGTYSCFQCELKYFLLNPCIVVIYYCLPQSTGWPGWLRMGEKRTKYRGGKMLL